LFSSGRDDPRPEQELAPAPEVEPGGAVHPPPALEELRHVDVLAVGDALLPGLGHERAQDRLARRIPREAGTPEGLGAEVALVEGAVLGQGERAPPIPKLEDALGRLSRQGLDGPGVVHEVPLAYGVGGVYLPPVVGIYVAQGGIDATGGPHCVGIAVPALAQDQNVDAGPCQLYCYPEPRGPGTDDQYVGLQQFRGVTSVLATVTRHVFRLSKMLFACPGRLRGCRSCDKKHTTRTTRPA
jgi:hypothetical protein